MTDTRTALEIALDMLASLDDQTFAALGDALEAS